MNSYRKFVLQQLIYTDLKAIIEVTFMNLKARNVKEQLTKKRNNQKKPKDKKYCPLP